MNFTKCDDVVIELKIFQKIFRIPFMMTRKCELWRPSCESRRLRFRLIKIIFKKIIFSISWIQLWNVELIPRHSISSAGTKERRAHLRENKFFECDCDRCADATERATYLSALKCQKCSLGNVLPVRPLDDTSHWQCDRCAYKLKADVHAKVLSKLKQEMEALDSNDVEE